MKYIPMLLIIIFCFLCYYGTGMVFHYYLIGDAIDWNSSGSLGVIFGWPFVAMIIVFAICIVTGLFAAVYFLLKFIYESVFKPKDNVFQQVMREAAKQKSKREE